MSKANKLILSYFWEEYHQLIYDTLNNKKTQLVCLYFVYRPKKYTSRTDITNDDKKAYVFLPTYGYGYTALCRHMISFVVFLYSNTLQSLLVDYTVPYMGLVQQVVQYSQ